jgi:tetratricopeptide (TPR) repeat protein
MELNADYFQAYLDIGSACLAQGRPEQALEWYRRGQGLETSVRSYDAFIVRALAALGRQDEADAILQRLEEESRQHYIRAEVLAMGYAAAGHADQAFLSLERAYQARSAGLIFLHVAPGYEPLKADSRYAALMGRIGLRTAPSSLPHGGNDVLPA